MEGESVLKKKPDRALPTVRQKNAADRRIKVRTGLDLVPRVGCTLLLAFASLADKERAQMSHVEVLGDIAADDLLISLEQIEVTLSLLRRELEGDV
jgi:hypothetical protein